MNKVIETGNIPHNEDGLLTFHIRQVPQNIGLIQVVKNLANPDREVERAIAI